MQFANYEPWLGLVKVQKLARAMARAGLLFMSWARLLNELGSFLKRAGSSFKRAGSPFKRAGSNKLFKIDRIDKIFRKKNFF